MSKLFLSASKLTTYLACPRKYRLRYIDRIQQPRPTFFIIGTSLHAGIEHLHLGKTLDEARAHASLIAEAETEQPYDNQLTRPEIQDTVSKLITVYSEQATPWNITKAEEEFEIEGQNVVLTGTLDAILDNFTKVGEIKTAKKAWTQANADLQLQASVYGYHLRFSHGIKEPITVVYRILIKPSKKYPNGNFQELHTIRHDTHFGHLTQTITEVGKAITHEIFPRNMTAACGWCDYKTICLGDACPDSLKGETDA